MGDRISFVGDINSAELAKNILKGLNLDGKKDSVTKTIKLNIEVNGAENLKKTNKQIESLNKALSADKGSRAKYLFTTQANAIKEATNNLKIYNNEADKNSAKAVKSAKEVFKWTNAYQAHGGKSSDLSEDLLSVADIGKSKLKNGSSDNYNYSIAKLTESINLMQNISANGIDLSSIAIQFGLAEDEAMKFVTALGYVEDQTTKLLRLKNEIQSLYDDKDLWKHVSKNTDNKDSYTELEELVDDYIKSGGKLEDIDFKNKGLSKTYNDLKKINNRQNQNQTTQVIQESTESIKKQNHEIDGKLVSESPIVQQQKEIKEVVEQTTDAIEKQNKVLSESENKSLVSPDKEKDYLPTKLTDENITLGKSINRMISIQDYYEKLKKENALIQQGNEMLLERAIYLDDNGYKIKGESIGSKERPAVKINPPKKTSDVLHTHPKLLNDDVNRLMFSDHDIETLVSEKIKRAFIIYEDKLLSMDLSKVDAVHIDDLKNSILNLYRGVFSYLGASIKENGNLDVENMPVDIQNEACKIINTLLADLLKEYGGSLNASRFTYGEDGAYLENIDKDIFTKVSKKDYSNIYAIINSINKKEFDTIQKYVKYKGESPAIEKLIQDSPEADLKIEQKKDLDDSHKKSNYIESFNEESSGQLALQIDGVTEASFVVKNEQEDIQEEIKKTNDAIEDQISLFDNLGNVKNKSNEPTKTQPDISNDKGSPKADLPNQTIKSSNEQIIKKEQQDSSVATPEIDPEIVALFGQIMEASEESANVQQKHQEKVQKITEETITKQKSLLELTREFKDLRSSTGINFDESQLKYIEEKISNKKKDIETWNIDEVKSHLSSASSEIEQFPDDFSKLTKDQAVKVTNMRNMFVALKQLNGGKLLGKDVKGLGFTKTSFDKIINYFTDLNSMIKKSNEIISNIKNIDTEEELDDTVKKIESKSTKKTNPSVSKPKEEKQVEKEKDEPKVVAELQQEFIEDKRNSTQLSALNKNIDSVKDSLSNLKTEITEIKNAFGTIDDESGIQPLLSSITNISESLIGLKSVFVDVGEGQEFSPLLSMINQINEAIGKLEQTVSKIKLNINLDTGMDEISSMKIEGRKQDLLRSYKERFSAMKLYEPGNDKVVSSMFGRKSNSSLVSDLNKSILEFDESIYDNIEQKIKAYESIINRMEQVSKELYGTNVYENMDSRYKKNVSTAKSNLSRAINSTKSSSQDEISNLFGKTDLSNVENQLQAISDSLNKIVEAAEKFKEAFNVNIEFGKIGESFKEEQNTVDDTVTSEKSSLETLEQKIRDIITAVNEKTDAFTNEQTTVDSAITSEVQKLQELIEKIEIVITTIEKLGNSPIDIKVNADANEILSELKTTLSGDWGTDLQTLTTFLSELKINKNAATNMQKLANAILTLKTNLNNLGDGGATFLSSINKLIDDADGLKDLATVLKATKNDIEKAKQATGQDKSIVDKDYFDANVYSMKDSASKTLSDKYLDVEMVEITRSEKGIVSLTAAIKDANGEWKKFTGNIDSDGKLSTSGVTELTKSRRNELEQLDKVSYEPNDFLTVSTESIKTATDEWNLACMSIKDYAEELGNVQDITMQMQKNKKTGKRMISYTVRGDNGNSLIVGANGDVLKANIGVSKDATEAKIQQNRDIEEYNAKGDWRLKEQKDYYDALTSFSNKYAKALENEAKAKTESDKAIEKSLKRHYKKEMDSVRDDMKANGIKIDPDKEAKIQEKITNAENEAKKKRVKIADEEIRKKEKVAEKEPKAKGQKRIIEKDFNEASKISYDKEIELLEKINDLKIKNIENESNGNETSIDNNNRKIKKLEEILELEKKIREATGLETSEGKSRIIDTKAKLEEDYRIAQEESRKVAEQTTSVIEEQNEALNETENIQNSNHTQSSTEDIEPFIFGNPNEVEQSAEATTDAINEVSKAYEIYKQKVDEYNSPSEKTEEIISRLTPKLEQLRDNQMSGNKYENGDIWSQYNSDEVHVGKEDLSKKFLNKYLKKMPKSKEDIKTYIDNILSNGTDDEVLTLQKVMSYYEGDFDSVNHDIFSDLKSSSKQKAFNLSEITNDYIEQWKKAKDELDVIKSEIEPIIRELLDSLNIEGDFDSQIYGILTYKRSIPDIINSPKETFRKLFDRNNPIDSEYFDLVDISDIQNVEELENKLSALIVRYKELKKQSKKKRSESKNTEDEVEADRLWEESESLSTQAAEVYSQIVAYKELKNIVSEIIDEQERLKNIQQEISGEVPQIEPPEQVVDFSNEHNEHNEEKIEHQPTEEHTTPAPEPQISEQEDHLDSKPVKISEEERKQIIKDAYDEQIRCMKEINRLQIENKNASSSTIADNNDEIQFLQQTIDLLQEQLRYYELIDSKQEERVSKTAEQLQNKYDKTVSTDYRDLIKEATKTELNIQRLLAAQDSGVITSSEAEELNRLISLRDQLNEKISQTTDLTRAEMQIKDRYQRFAENETARERQNLEYSSIDIDSNRGSQIVEETNESLQNLRNRGIHGLEGEIDSAEQAISDLTAEFVRGSRSAEEYEREVEGILRPLQRVQTVLGNNMTEEEGETASSNYIENYINSIGGRNLNIESTRLDYSTGIMRTTASFIDADHHASQLVTTLNLVNGQLTQVVETGERSTLLGKVFDKFGEAFTNVTTYFATTFSLDWFIEKVQEGIEYTIEFDTALTEMRKVSDESVSSLKNFQAGSFDMANEVGTTALQIQQSTADFMRLGESLEEASESAKVANKLMNVSEFESIDAATEALIAMKAAYDEIDQNVIVDKLNQVGNNFAISTDGLASALQKSASALTTAGNDIDESIALITAGNQVVQDPESVGAGLRTIALRLTGKIRCPNT